MSSCSTLATTEFVLDCMEAAFTCYFTFIGFVSCRATTLCRSYATHCLTTLVSRGFDSSKAAQNAQRRSTCFHVHKPVRYLLLTSAVSFAACRRSARLRQYELLRQPCGACSLLSSPNAKVPRDCWCLPDDRSYCLFCSLASCCCFR